MFSLKELRIIKPAIEWEAADYGPADEATMLLIAKVDALIAFAETTAAVVVQGQGGPSDD